MSYEQEDHYGFEVTPRWIAEPEEEETMSQPGAKRFEEWKKNYPEPKFMTGDEIPVETDGPYIFMDLPALRTVADTNWESVEACRREAQARLDRSNMLRGLANMFWATLIVGALAAGAFYAVRWFYTAVLG